MPGLLNLVLPQRPARAVGPPPRPRRVELRFGPDIPRHWIAGRPTLTHLVNSLGLIFPAGERFFVRAVRRYLDTLDDPRLRAAVSGFIGQEMHHARQHERFFETLRQQGYEFDLFLRIYETIAYGLIERLSSPKTNLATTAALEHFTAAFARLVFRRAVFTDAHPVMRDLFLWHAAEELEHKAIVYDVLQRIDDRLSVRLKGLAIALPLLLAFWVTGSLVLVAQDREMTIGERLKDALSGAFRDEFGASAMLMATLTYLLPGFHPDQVPDGETAARYLASLPG